MRKKIATLILAIIFITALPYASFASEVSVDDNTSLQNLNNFEVDTNLERISATLSELSMIYATNLRDSLLDDTHKMLQSTNTSFASIENCENRLAELGVIEITYEEMLEMFPDSNMNISDTTNGIVVPPSSSSVKWYASSPATYYMNGIPYKLQFLYAQGIGTGTNLCEMFSGRLYETKEYVFQALQEMAGIYVQKAIGLIPLVQWTPYELAFSGPNETYTSTEHSLVYSALETACFAYVYPVSLGENYIQLTFSSNTYTIASTQINFGIKNEKPYSDSWDDNQIVTAENYASSVAAVNAYDNPYADIYSFAGHLRFQAGPNGSHYRYFYPTCADSPMGVS